MPRLSDFSSINSQQTKESHKTLAVDEPEIPRLLRSEFSKNPPHPHNWLHASCPSAWVVTHFFIVPFPNLHMTFLRGMIQLRLTRSQLLLTKGLIPAP